jgi:hypothetical protein
VAAVDSAKNLAVKGDTAQEHVFVKANLMVVEEEEDYEQFWGDFEYRGQLGALRMEDANQTVQPHEFRPVRILLFPLELIMITVLVVLIPPTLDDSSLFSNLPMLTQYFSSWRLRLVQ